VIKPHPNTQTMAAANTNFAHLLPPSWTKHVQLWLEDDIPSFDVGGFVVGGASRSLLRPASPHSI
jgi:hypothetical protein